MPLGHRGLRLLFPAAPAHLMGGQGPARIGWGYAKCPRFAPSCLAQLAGLNLSLRFKLTPFPPAQAAAGSTADSLTSVRASGGRIHRLRQLVACQSLPTCAQSTRRRS